MIDAFCRWWLRDELADKKALIAAYLELIEEYRNQKN